MVKAGAGNLINIITPVGSIEGLYDTMYSIWNVAAQTKNFKFNHILIFNNNIKPKINFKKTKNYKYTVKDINPVSSRSTARNNGLISINNETNSFVIFIDAGDSLLEDAIKKISKLQIGVDASHYMIVAQTFINFSNKLKLIRVPLFPLRMKNIVNPFMLGSIILPTNLAKKVKFYEGKKEDWVYWKEILDLKPQIIFTNEPNYIYNVSDIPEHYKKKISSIIQLRKILIKKFKWGRTISYVISIVHFFLISCRWFLLRSKHYAGGNE